MYTFHLVHFCCQNSLLITQKHTIAKHFIIRNLIKLFQLSGFSKKTKQYAVNVFFRLNTTKTNNVDNKNPINLCVVLLTNNKHTHTQTHTHTHTHTLKYTHLSLSTLMTNCFSLSRFIGGGIMGKEK